MSYLKIAKELINSPFWNTMSLSEQGLLVNLLNKVPFKEVTYNLYGHEIQLQPLEVCFSLRRMSRKFGISHTTLKRMLEKFEAAGVIQLNIRKIGHSVTPSVTTESDNSEAAKGPCRLTSVTFSAWAVQGFTRNPEKEPSEEVVLQPDVTTDVTHKNNVFKNINNKLCVGANAENQNSENPWYPLKAFANLTIRDPEAWIHCLCEELQTDSKKLIEAIAQFCKRQKDMGFNQMTKVFFSQQFIRYFNNKKRSKPEHNGKSCKPSAPEQLNEQPESEIDRQLKDLAAKRRRFGRNRSGGDDT